MIRLPIFLVAKFCPNAISDNPNFTRTKNFHFNVKKGFLKYFFLFLFNKLHQRIFSSVAEFFFEKSNLVFKGFDQKLWNYFATSCTRLPLGGTPLRFYSTGCRTWVLVDFVAPAELIDHCASGTDQMISLRL